MAPAAAIVRPGAILAPYRNEPGFIWRSPVIVVAAAPTLLLTIHTALAPMALAVGGATVLCGVALVFMTRAAAVAPAGPREAFRFLLTTTAVLGVLQVLCGALLFLFGERPADQLHFVYGGIVLLAIPVAYAYSDQKDVRRDIIVMTIAAVAIIGAAIRAIMTGG